MSVLFSQTESLQVRWVDYAHLVPPHWLNRKVATLPSDIATEITKTPLLFQVFRSAPAGVSRVDSWLDRPWAFGKSVLIWLCIASATEFRVSSRFNLGFIYCRPQFLLMEIQVSYLPLPESDQCQKRFQAAVDVIQNLPKNGRVSLSMKNTEQSGNLVPYWMCKTYTL